MEEEEEYYSWIEIANTKLNEVDEAIEELASQSNYAKEQGDYAKTIGDQLIEDKENGLFKGEQGEPGKDGYTPQKGVDYFDGKDGADGKDGEDGKDYVLTEKDKQEIVQLVLSSLPDGDEVSY